MIKLPDGTHNETLADWAEASCLFENDGSLSRSEITQFLDQSQVTDPDVVAENVWQEIRNRSTGGPKAYPIHLDADAIRWSYEWKRNSPYLFQLLLACFTYYPEARLTGRNLNEAAKLFELLANHAVQTYMGGRATNIGFPRQGSIPRSFSKCLDQLCAELGELRGQTKSFGRNTKDEHVDTIAWRSFGDRRPNQAIMLLQCGTGSDWKDKAHDIVIDVWGDLIDYAVVPSKGLAFPFFCRDSFEWRKLSKEAGLLLDRFRLTSLFYERPQQELEANVIAWCERWLGSLNSLKL